MLLDRPTRLATELFDWMSCSFSSWQGEGQSTGYSMSRRRKRKRWRRRKRRGFLRHHSTPTPTLPFQSYAGTAGAGQALGHQSCCLPSMGKRDWERWMGGKMEGRSLQTRGGTSPLLLLLPPCTPLAQALRTREHRLSKGKKKNTVYTKINVPGGFTWQRAGQAPAQSQGCLVAWKRHHRSMLPLLKQRTEVCLYQRLE